MTTMKLAAIAVVGNIWLPVSAIAETFSKIQFDSSSPDAIIMIEEAEGMWGGSVTFVEVDLQNLSKGPRKFSMGKDTLTGRLGTQNKGLRTQSEYMAFDYGKSRFSAAKRPSGYFALVRYTYSDPGSFGVSCLADGFPVFHFKAGQANLITAAMLPRHGRPVPVLGMAKMTRNGSNDDIGDAQSILNERSGIKAEVVEAKIVAKVQFVDKFGGAASCGKGEKLMIVQ